MQSWCSLKKTNKPTNCALTGGGGGRDEQRDCSWAVGFMFVNGDIVSDACPPTPFYSKTSQDWIRFVLSTQRSPGRDADEPLLGGKSQSGKCPCFLVFAPQSHLPEHVWTDGHHRPLRFCGEDEHKHARWTPEELTGPPAFKNRLSR